MSSSRRTKKRIVTEPEAVRDEAYAEIPQGEPEIVAITGIDGVKRYLVALLYSPTLEIEARDEAEAWERYKQRTSILATDHKPQIRVKEVLADGDGHRESSDDQKSVDPTTD